MTSTEVAGCGEIDEMAPAWAEVRPVDCECQNSDRGRRILHPHPAECLCCSIARLVAGQLESQPPHGWIMPDDQQVADVRWRLARQIEQIRGGRPIDPILKDGRRMSTQILLGELAGLASAPSRRAHHPIGHIAKLMEPAACSRSVPTAAGRQRAVMIGHAFGPSGLRVPQQDQSSGGVARHRAQLLRRPIGHAIGCHSAIRPVSASDA
jgi:hypothetical protein